MGNAVSQLCLVVLNTSIAQINTKHPSTPFVHYPDDGYLLQ